MRIPRKLASLLGALLVGYSATAPADVLDQSLTGGPGLQGSIDVNAALARAQSFTVGVGGTLSRVFLSLAESGTQEGDALTVDVRPTDETGAPLLEDGTALGIVIVPASQLGTTLDFENLFELDFSAAAIPVTEGQRLAIVARSGIPFGSGRQIALGAMIGGTYAGGDAWVRTSSWSLQDGGGTDWVFETYVEVPEPGNAASAALLALLGLAGLSRRRR